MLNGEIVVATLKELLKRGGATTTDACEGKLKDISEKAHRRMMCGGEFPSQLTMSALCGGLRTKRPRLIETCLGCVQHLLHVHAFHPDRQFSAECNLPCFAPAATALARAAMPSALFPASSQQQPRSGGGPSGGGLSPRHGRDATGTSATSATPMCALGGAALPEAATPTTIGSTLVDCLIDLLATVNDVAVQLKALELLLLCAHPFKGGGGGGVGLKAYGSGVSPFVDHADPTVHGIPLRGRAVSDATTAVAPLLQDPFGLFSTTLLYAVDTCFRLSLSTTHAGVQIASYGVLTTLLRRAVRTFILDATPNPCGPAVIAIAGGLRVTNYVSDRSPVAPYTAIRITGQRGVAKEGGGSVSNSFELADQSPPQRPDRGSPEGDDAIDPTTAGGGRTAAECSSVAACALTSSEGIPLRDLIAIVKGLCHAASRPLPSSATDEDAEPSRTRVQGLKLLFLLFDELPRANNEAEHPCAFWMSVLMECCKYELLKTISRSIATIAPACFFTASLDVLRILLHKAHYHMHRELYALLNIVVFPLMRSRYSSASQKLSFLFLVRTIVSTPHLLVAYFINYDCSPAFDPGNQYGGGMLSALMDALVAIPYVAYQGTGGGGVSDGWCTDDQQTMLCTEVTRIMHDFVASMKRWVYEDPKAYNRREDDEAIGSISKNYAAGTTDAMMDGRRRHAVATELYLDAWSSDSDSDGDSRRDDADAMSDDFIGGASSDPTTHDDGGNTSLASGQDVVTDDETRMARGAGRTTPPPQATAAGAGGALQYFTLPGGTASRRAHPIAYHWQHVHLCLHNKRILDEAALRTNSNWRRGRAYLVEQQVLSSEEDLVGFARFLKEHPAIEKGLLCSVFERVTKEPECAGILQAYLNLFAYAGVPIDIALRDTTCEFMSWERPQFEAQVWERIQGLFGAAYAAQNADAISERDADVAAGVLLFLHTSLHNSNVKQQSKMTEAQFIRDGSACMEHPLPEAEMRAMFERVHSKRWALDCYQRTPKQQELAEQQEKSVWLRRPAQRCGDQIDGSMRRRSQTTPTPDALQGTDGTSPLCAVVSEPSSATVPAEGNDGLRVEGPLVEEQQPPVDRRSSVESSSLSPRTAAVLSRSASSTIQNQSSLDVSTFSSKFDCTAKLFESRFESYTAFADRIRLKHAHEQLYVKAATLQLTRLEAEHRRQRVSRVRLCGSMDRQSGLPSDASDCNPQQHPDCPPLLPEQLYTPPYLVPHYAQHIQPMFLAFYPHVVAVCYVGLRELKQEPALRLVLDIYQNLYDVAAAFCIDVAQLRGVTEKLIQKCLRQEGAIRLGPESIRASITPYLMHRL